jgi:mannitol-1-phosphate 5-dehydrogenase
VCTAVEAALAESCTGMEKRHRMDRAALDAHAQDLLHRYGNRGLGDQVARIGKDPVRKLGPNDRLVGAMRMCFDQGVQPRHIGLGAAAALHFNPPGDPTAPRVQELMTSRGPEGVFEEVCDLRHDSEIAQLVLEQEDRLRRENWL